MEEGREGVREGTLGRKGGKEGGRLGERYNKTLFSFKMFSLFLVIGFNQTEFVLLESNRAYQLRVAVLRGFLPQDISLEVTPVSGTASEEGGREGGREGEERGGERRGGEGSEGEGREGGNEGRRGGGKERGREDEWERERG